jgi:hypothetical protein
MPITAITIENFKGIKEPVRVEFKPITLLFGPNSAGKSTIVQALHYALEIFDRNNLDPDKTSIGGKAIDLGGFETLVYNHDLSNPIRLKIELELQEDLPQYFDGYEDMGLFQFDEKILEIPMKATTASVEITIIWNHQLEMPILRQYKVDINGYELAVLDTTDDGKQVFITSVNPFNPVFLEKIIPKEAKDIIKRYLIEDLPDKEDEFEKIGPIFSALLRNFKLEGGVAGMTKPIGIISQGSALPEWGKALKFHSQVWADETDLIAQGNLLMCLSSLIVGPGELIRDELKKLYYIGPIREIPKRNYIPEKSPDKSRWSSGLKGWDIVYKAEKGFINSLNQWLTHKERLNTGYSIETKHYREIDVEDPISLLMSQGVGLEELELIQTKMGEIPVKSRVAIREELTGIDLTPQDVGVGISQVLPLVVAALYIKEGMLAIEQPELHIHPALQVALGDLFISKVQERGLCFLLETHSEHLMLRFLRRIRETGEGSLPPGKEPLKPDQLGVYYVERGEKGISLTRIRVDQEGEFIDHWPKGFFSERAEELF